MSPTLPSRAELRLWLRTIATARHVTDAPRFALNELLLRRRTRRYTLRGSRRDLVVRHPVVDAFVLAEALDGVYAPPPEVVAALADDPPATVVELGGHIGTMTLFLLDRFPSSDITVFEAHPDNARILEAAVRANGVRDRVTVRPQAAGTASGRLVLEGSSALAHAADQDGDVLDAFPFVRGLLGPSRPVDVEVVDALPALVGADLLKIDIEGGEWPILADPRFAGTRARAVVMEYHHMGAPGPNPREEAVRLLRAAGFTVGPMDAAASPDVGMLWAWR